MLLLFTGFGIAEVDGKSKAGKIPDGIVTIEKTHPQDNRSITINNGIINIEFGEDWSGYDVWYYRGKSNAFKEEPYFSYGENNPVALSDGTIYSSFPDTGVPDVWYSAIIGLDLDGDRVEDVKVARSIMVPSSGNYFLVRYCIENIVNESLNNFRVFQGVDYDVEYTYTDDEGGYNSQGDFVWEHNMSGYLGTYVGFKGSLLSSHHDVGNYEVMWSDIENGALNDANYYQGDVGVALEWNLGTLNTGETKCLVIKFGFADTYDELRWMFIKPVPAFSMLTSFVMAGILAGLALLSLRREI